jgi:hypothetical protein
MKTNYVLLATALSCALSADGQGFLSNFNMSPWKQGISVENKAGAEKEFVEQQKLLTGAFERAINTFSNALTQHDPTNHPLQKTLGPLQSPAALRALQTISFNVTMLDKSDPLYTPVTQILPTIGGDKVTPYLTRIPYTLLKKATTAKQMEYLALRAVASIVNGAPIPGVSSLEDEQREQHLEYSIYQVAGRHMYLEYHMAWAIAYDPDITPEGLRNYCDRCLQWIGVIDETESTNGKKSQ